MRLADYNKMFDIFERDARCIGAGYYTIWAPAKDGEPARVVAQDTAVLLRAFLDRFKKVGDLYDLDTVWEEEEDDA